jgi:SAM-dependent methyltransferase
VTAHPPKHSVNGAAVNGTHGAADFDRLPYPSLPVDYSEPAHLAAMARMFGLAAPDAANARVLELGCASGGNIIPLAARFPNASFLGIDLSQRHVEQGQRRAAQLDLRNIKIVQGDLTQSSFGPEAFDYIICHGVFSWVPKAAQDAILRICGESLSADGVAAVSYNVLPGWHMRRVVRDICLMHADPREAPEQRVAKAREAVSGIAQALKGNTPYAVQLRHEAEKLAKAPAAYVLGEFLSEHNVPCYFSEFAGRAGAQGLSFVCEADVATSLPEFFFPEALEQIRARARGNTGALQQYTDFFSGRQFRRSLLVKSSRAKEISPTIDVSRLRDLHFSAELKLDETKSKPDAPVFVDVKGRLASPKDPLVAHMLSLLASRYPSTSTVAELAGTFGGNQDAERRVLSTLLTLLGNEQASASVLPMHVGSADRERPLAWAPARLDAAARQPWASGQHHKAVKMSAPIALMLPLMDGTRDRAALRGAMAEIIERAGASADATLNGERDLDADLDGLVATALTYAARHGLLLA